MIPNFLSLGFKFDVTSAKSDIHLQLDKLLTDVKLGFFLFNYQITLFFRLKYSTAVNINSSVSPW